LRKHLRVFVATGTGPAFTRLLEALRALANEPSVELFAQRGSAGPSFHDVPGEDFIPREEFAKRLVWADVVVSHAGSGAMYEAYMAGHVPILVPRLSRFGEAVNDHQLELATSLANAGKAALCDDLSRLRDIVLSAKRRGHAISVQAALVEVVRNELRAPGRPTLAKATGLLPKKACPAGFANPLRRRSA